MKYYEIKDMDHPDPDGHGTRILSEDELDMRLTMIQLCNPDDGYMPYSRERQIEILLHGQAKEAPDPWEEWAEGVADSMGWGNRGETFKNVKAALLKLRDLVERKGE